MIPTCGMIIGNAISGPAVSVDRYCECTYLLVEAFFNLDPLILDYFLKCLRRNTKVKPGWLSVPASMKLFYR